MNALKIYSGNEVLYNLFWTLSLFKLTTNRHLVNFRTNEYVRKYYKGTGG